MGEIKDRGEHEESKLPRHDQKSFKGKVNSRSLVLASLHAATPSTVQGRTDGGSHSQKLNFYSFFSLSTLPAIVSITAVLLISPACSYLQGHMARDSNKTICRSRAQILSIEQSPVLLSGLPGLF